MVAPLAVLGLVLGRKKKRGKWDNLIVLLVVCVVVGMSVSACDPLEKDDQTGKVAINLTLPPPHVVHMTWTPPASTSTPTPTASPTERIRMRCTVEGNGTPPNISNYDPTREPVNITWYPGIDVPLSPSIAEDGPDSQYAPFIAPEDMGQNLCGQVVLSMIAAKHGYGDVLYNLWIATQKPDGATDPYILLYAGIKVFSEKSNFSNWTGKAHAFTQSYSLSTSDLAKIQLKNDGFTLSNEPTIWYHQAGRFDTNESWSAPPENPGNYGEIAPAELYNKLQQGHYLMILTNLKPHGQRRELIPNSKYPGAIPLDDPTSKFSSGHWVLITGLSEQWDCDDDNSAWNWVRVNNPYNNRVEYYPWNDFKNTISTGKASYQLVEFWQP